MRQTQMLSAALLIALLVVASTGCATKPRGNETWSGDVGTEPTVESTDDFETHGVVVRPDDPTKPWIPAEAKGPVTIPPAGEVTFSPAGRKDWFARVGIAYMWYDQHIDDDYGTIWALGRRIGDGWFVEGQVSVIKAENEFTKGNVRYKDRGRFWFYNLNGGYEWFYDDDEMWRGRAHAGMGWYEANSITDEDTGWGFNLGTAVQFRVYENWFLELGGGYYSMRSNVGDNRNTFWNNFAVNLAIAVDF